MPHPSGLYDLEPLRHLTPRDDDDEVGGGGGGGGRLTATQARKASPVSFMRTSATWIPPGCPVVIAVAINDSPERRRQVGVD